LFPKKFVFAGLFAALLAGLFAAAFEFIGLFAALLAGLFAALFAGLLFAEGPDGEFPIGIRLLNRGIFCAALLATATALFAASLTDLNILLAAFVAAFAAPEATFATAFTAPLTAAFTAPEDCDENIFTL
jgi:hypothetical protein